jgi:hypothetical protein
MNTAAVAIELYLKCLSAEKVYTDAGRGWSIVSATPQRGHVLTALPDKVEGVLRDELDRAFQAELLHSGASHFGMHFNSAKARLKYPVIRLSQKATCQNARWTFSWGARISFSSSLTSCVPGKRFNGSSRLAGNENRLLRPPGLTGIP